jgi:hypothetical protein
MLNGDILKENERVRTERNQNKCSLIIDSAEEIDAGVYTIKATNEVGNDSFNINIVVEGYLSIFLHMLSSIY